MEWVDCTQRWQCSQQTGFCLILERTIFFDVPSPRRLSTGHEKETDNETMRWWNDESDGSCIHLNKPENPTFKGLMWTSSVVLTMGEIKSDFHINDQYLIRLYHDLITSWVYSLLIMIPYSKTSWYIIRSYETNRNIRINPATFLYFPCNNIFFNSSEH